MGRPAKYSEKTLIEQVDEYFVHVNGNTDVLTFKAVSDYAKEQGHDLPEHVFRRYPNVCAHFKSLKEQEKSRGEGADVFLTPDFQQTLGGCRKDCPNLCRVTARLNETGADYSEYYKKAMTTKEELLKCRAQCSDLEQEKASLDRLVREKEGEIKKLKKFIEKYITGAVGLHLIEKQIPGLAAELAAHLDRKEVEELTRPLEPPAQGTAKKSANDELLESLEEEEEKGSTAGKDTGKAAEAAATAGTESARAEKTEKAGAEKTEKPAGGTAKKPTTKAKGKKKEEPSNG